MDFEEFVRALALRNAVKHKGRASASALVGAVLAQFPEFRIQGSALLQKVQDVVDQVNLLSLAEQEVVVQQLGQAPVRERLQGLRPLEGVSEQGIVMRFAPSPSGALHIGHAYTLLLSALYVRRYGGRCIVRIEDTNPENIYPEAYHLIEESARWITREGISDVVVQSDRLELYYDYASRALEGGFAYVCTCDPEGFKVISDARRECPCRSLSVQEQLARWAWMLKDAPQGSCVMRIKTDMAHKNPALRDFPAMRINTAEHPRAKTKYRVWPLMNFSVFVDDVEMGMTHIIRAKDHADNAKKQAFLYAYFGKVEPRTQFVGKINFEGLPLSASKTRQRIAAGEFSGWDDLRLPFLPALRRRGYQPEAFWRYTEEVGVTATDKTIPVEVFFKNLNAFNKAIVDPVADRFFVVETPVRVPLQGAKDVQVSLDLHPGRKRGGRVFRIGEEILLDARDWSALALGGLLRLKDTLTARRVGDGLVMEGMGMDEARAHDLPIVHFLPVEDARACTLLYPDGSVCEGYCEAGVGALEPGVVFQAERKGFFRLEAKEPRPVLVFGHR
ncbi:MAG: glutamate--tRNA ligase [Nitrosarchaeum sp.]|nr:glutamate--tRNA ligase [Nitrosarchaeum sp.]